MDETGGSKFIQDLHRAPRLVRIVRGDADIQSLALADSRVEGSHCLFERRFGVKAMTVEDIHVVEPHTLEGRVETGKHIFARAPFAIWAGPHIVASLGGDNELVAVGMEILFVEGSKCD